MTDHRRALDLAAAELDWRLTVAERDEMDAHLAGCSSCQRAGAIQHRQAAALRSLAYAETPVAVRRVVLAAAATDARRGQRPTWTLLAAAALIALTTVGAAVGSYLLEREREARSEDLSLTPIPSPMTAAELARLRWTATPAVAAEFGDAAVSNVVAGPTGMVAFGQARATLGTVVWVSSDGRAWENIQQPSDAFGGGVPTHVVSGGPGYVALGWDISIESGTRRAVWTSADGRTWSRDPDPTGQFGVVDIIGMSSADGVVVVLASEAGGAGATTLRSADGFAWERSAAPAGLVPGVSGLASSVAGFVAFGSTDRPATAWHSADGRSWSTATVQSDGPGDPTAGRVIEHVVGSGPRLVVQGQGKSNDNFIWTSTDGRRWRAFSKDPTPRSDAVLAGGDGAFLAYLVPTAPDAPLVAWTSADGEAWTPLANSSLESEPPDLQLEPQVTVSQVVAVPDGWVMFGYETATGRVLVWTIR